MLKETKCKNKLNVIARNATMAQHGRSLIEMLGVLAVIALLAMSIIKTYHSFMNKVKVQNTAKMIQTLALERQNSAISASTGGRTLRQGPHSDLYLENGTVGKYKDYFWVDTDISDEDFCNGLKSVDMIGADVTEGTCPGKLTFYFRKERQGEARGTYQDGNGIKHFCAANMASCVDENTPTSCEEGYFLFANRCHTTTCTVDSDCASVCASCNDGTCTNECVVPEPDEEAETGEECGENDCIVYDAETQTCQYKCVRVDYLESTGTQYIDTGVIGDKETSVYIRFALTSTSGHQAIFGARSSWNSRALAFYNGQDTGFKFTLGFDSIDTPGRVISTISSNNTNWHTATIGKNTTIDSWIASYTDASTFTTPGALYLFSWNQTNQSYGSLQVSDFKITQSGELKLDFIPVLAPNGTPAMFDRVNNKLYYNAGNGTFDYSPKE